MHDKYEDLPKAAGEQLRRLRSGAGVSRAQFLAGAGASMAAFLAACGGSDSGSSSSGTSSTAGGTAASTGTPTSGPAEPFYVKGGELNIYSWPDYFAQADLDSFKAKTGVKVNIEAYESNEDMFAKLNTAAKSSYDIAIPTSLYVKVMGDLGIIEQLDPKRIPWQNIDRNLLNQSFDRGNKLSIPKTYGTSGLLYDPKKTGQITDYKGAIAMLQKPEFSGKVNLPEGGKDLLNWGMQALGYDYNSPKIAQWREAADYLTKNVVAHVNAFGGTFTPDQIHSGKVVAMTTDSAVARRAILQSPGLKYAILAPQSQLWVDNYTIIKGSPNKEQAYSFISHMLQPTVQVTETEELGYATALKGIEDKIDSSFKHPEVVFPSANDYEHLVPSELNEDVQGEIDKLASQVTASAA